MTAQADGFRTYTTSEVREGLACSAEALKKATEEYESWLLASKQVELSTRAVGKIVGRDSTSVGERIRRLSRAHSQQPEHQPTPVNSNPAN